MWSGKDPIGSSGVICFWGKKDWVVVLCERKEVKREVWSFHLGFCGCLGCKSEKF